MEIDWGMVGLKIVETLLPIVIALVIAALNYGVMYLRRQISKLENDTLKKAIGDALTEAQTVGIEAVKATQQVFVNEIKEKSEDGKLTKEEAKQAMKIAKEYFMSHISKHSLKILQAAIGPIEDWLESFLEAKVYDLKTFTGQEVVIPLSSLEGTE